MVINSNFSCFSRDLSKYLVHLSHLVCGSILFIKVSWYLYGLFAKSSTSFLASSRAGWKWEYSAVSFLSNNLKTGFFTICMHSKQSNYFTVFESFLWTVCFGYLHNKNIFFRGGLCHNNPSTKMLWPLLCNYRPTERLLLAAPWVLGAEAELLKEGGGKGGWDGVECRVTLFNFFKV